MKVFIVYGFSKTGKTATIEKIIAELRERGYRVGAIKKSFHHDIEYDKEGKDTYKMEKSGAEIVGGLSRSRACLFFAHPVKPMDFIKMFNTDYLIIEGNLDIAVPRIFCAEKMEDLEKLDDPLVFAITGKISGKLKEYKGIPVFNALMNTEEMVNFIERKVFPLLPQLNCEQCGYNCRELACKILNGEKTIEDCVILSKSRVEIKIGGKPVHLAPFLEAMFKNIITGFLEPLKGFEEGREIEIKIKS